MTNKKSRKPQFLIPLSMAAVMALSTMAPAAQAFQHNGQNVDGVQIGNNFYSMGYITSHSNEFGNIFGAADPQSTIIDFNGRPALFSGFIGSGMNDIDEFASNPENQTPATPSNLIDENGEETPVDSVPPVLVYTGETTINLANGAEFILPVVTGTDNKDETVNVAHVIKNAANEVIQAIDTKVAGTYTITYSAKDAAGNAAKDLVVTVIVAEVPALQVASVNAITETNIEVKLALNTKEAVAKDKSKYIVTVGAEVVEVKEVTYNLARNISTLTVDLKGKEGKLQVNGKESADFDFKAPAVTNAIPVGVNLFKIVFNEALNPASVIGAKYSLVETGTANVIAIKKAELLADNKTVLVTTEANLTDGASYTVGVKDVKDVKFNAIEKWQNAQFIAVKDTEKPTIIKAVSTDANKIEITMSEDIKLDDAKAIMKFYDDKGNFVKDGDTDKEITLVDIKVSDNIKLVITIPDKANYLDNGKRYNITVTGVKDSSGNAIEANQNADFVGVRDVVAPTVEGSKYDAKDNTLQITFSEAMNEAAVKVVENYKVVETKTGVAKGAVSNIVYDGKKNSVTFKLPALGYSTEYTVVLSNLKDAAIIANAMQANTKVNFTSAAKELQSTALTVATATDDGKGVKLTFTSTLAKAEAENAANYSIVAVDKPEKILTVTKAILADSVVTLTTDKQDGAKYKVIVSNISNLETGKNTAEFTSKDIIAPTLSSINVINNKVVDLTFSENISNIAKENITVFDVDAVKLFTDFSVSVNENKLRITCDPGKEFTSDKTYRVAVTGLQDKAANTAKDITSEFKAVAGDTTPAKITGVTVLNEANIVLQFDEEIVKDEAISVDITYPKDNKQEVLATITTGKIENKNKLNLELPADKYLENGVEYTVTVKSGVKDLVGNETKDASYKFAGYRDTEAPKLLSAKPGDKDDTVILTFSEAIGDFGNKDDYVVTNENTYKEIAVTKVEQDDKDKSVVKLILGDGNTVAGEKYRVYVKGDVKDTAKFNGGNIIAEDHRLATFTGIDTTAPKVNDLQLDGTGVVIGEIVDNKSDINITFNPETKAVASGSLTISEDVFVKMDAIEDQYDIVNAIPVSISAAEQAVDLILTIFSDSGVKGASVETLKKNSGTTVTIYDAAGNTTIYTLNFKDAE